MAEDLDPSSLTIRCLGDRKISSPLEKLMAECTQPSAHVEDERQAMRFTQTTTGSWFGTNCRTFRG